MKANIYEQITSKIIEQLENGIIPWQKPWINQTGAGCISHANGKPYSLLNQMLLGCRAGEWLTYNQIQAEGGSIKKGEKASMVVFWTFVEKYELEAVCDDKGNQLDGDKGVRKVVTGYYPILKSYYVFHIEQCEGIEPKYHNEAIQYEHTPIEEAERVAMEYIAREQIKLEIQNGDRACYNPLLDRVRIPEMSQYAVVEEYYSTMFHELTHSTGHSKRLNRDGIAGVHFFGDEGYSKEELVAEMGAAYMCQSLGLECDKAFKNSIGYIQSWLRELKNDKRLIVSAAAKAEAAVKFMMGEK